MRKTALLVITYCNVLLVLYSFLLSLVNDATCDLLFQVLCSFKSNNFWVSQLSFCVVVSKLELF